MTSLNFLSGNKSMFELAELDIEVVPLLQPEPQMAARGWLINFPHFEFL